MRAVSQRSGKEHVDQSEPQRADQSTAAKPRVLIADKSPVVRAGLEDYIRKDGRFEVLGSTANGQAFASIAQDRSADIGVVGWSLPDMSGVDVIALMKRRQSKVRIIIYTGDSSADVLRQCVREGAWGFTSKSEDPDVLIETIAAVSRGRLSVPYVDIRTITSDPLEVLTARERELLAALANGWTNMQIAARIGISSNTVKYHLKNLYDKLGVNNRAMAVAMFMSSGRDQRL
jgi:DNA-binding NarL/FixJ family response regulator